MGTMGLLGLVIWIFVFTNSKDQVLSELWGLNHLYYFEFQEDYLFSSPSAAAAQVLARNANGWIEWKNKQGKTLDELKRK